MKSKFQLFINCIAALILVSSCVEDEFQRLEKIKWNPAFAAPLVNSSLSIDDLITDSSVSFVEIAPDLFITLVYNGKQITNEAQSFITLVNSTISTPITISALQLQQFNALPVGQSIDLSIPLVLNVSNWLPSGYEMDSVWLKSGTISMQMTNQSSITMNVTLSSSNLLFGSSALFETFALPPTGQKNSNYSASNAQLRLVSNGLPNRWALNLSVSLQKTNNVPITSTTVANINWGTNQLKYSRMFGLIPGMNLPINLNDSAKINLFRNTIQGQVSFQNPEIRVSLYNSFGCPANTQLQAFLGVSNITGEVQLPVTGISNPINLPAAIATSNGTQSLLLNNTNSNIASAINTAPRFLALDAAMSLTGSAPPRHFVSDTSKIGINFQVRIPMHGTATQFLLKDTFDIELAQSVEEIEWALIRLNLTNGFPIDMDAQAYFVTVNKDVYGNIIQTLIIDSVLQTGQNLILPSADVDATGRVSAPKNKITDVQISANRWRNLENNGVNSIIVKFRFNSLNQGNSQVKLYSDYRIDVKIGAQVQTRFKL